MMLDGQAVSLASTLFAPRPSEQDFSTIEYAQPCFAAFEELRMRLAEQSTCVGDGLVRAPLRLVNSHLSPWRGPVAVE